MKVCFDGGDAGNGVGVAAVLGRAAVDDAGLVEMDVGFDQARAGQVALGVVGWRVLAGRLGSIATILPAAMPISTGWFAEQAGVANDEVHAVPS